MRVILTAFALADADISIEEAANIILLASARVYRDVATGSEKLMKQQAF